MTELALRLAVDLAAVAVLVHAIFLPRHRRADLGVTYALFNVGLFLALTVIAGGEVSIGVGFGLFAVLSIVRLRSEPFSNRELGYFFVALVLALVCAIDAGPLELSAALAAVALAAAWVLDHPRVSRPAPRVELLLELVFADDEALRRHLEERLAARVVDVSVSEIDYVRETTRACVSYVPRAAPPAEIDAAVLVR
jgi:hypothetical protein